MNEKFIEKSTLMNDDSGSNIDVIDASSGSCRKAADELLEEHGQMKEEIIEIEKIRTDKNDLEESKKNPGEIASSHELKSNTVPEDNDGKFKQIDTKTINENIVCDDISPVKFPVPNHSKSDRPLPVSDSLQICGSSILEPNMGKSFSIADNFRSSFEEVIEGYIDNSYAITYDGGLYDQDQLLMCSDDAKDLARSNKSIESIERHKISGTYSNDPLDSITSTLLPEDVSGIVQEPGKPQSIKDLPGIVCQKKRASEFVNIGRSQIEELTVNEVLDEFDTM